MGARRQYGAVLTLKQVTAFSYSAHAVSQSGRNLNDIALVFRALAAAHALLALGLLLLRERRGHRKQALGAASRRLAPRPFRFIPPKRDRVSCPLGELSDKLSTERSESEHKNSNSP